MTGAKRRRSRRIRQTLGIVVSGALLLATAGGTSLALATDQETVSSTITTDTLDPATDLQCNGAASCTVAVIDDPVLTWTATTDTYGTGYDVLRSTTSGSGYTVIASVSGRTTTTYTDTTVAPLTTYYYVVRAVAGAWISSVSNEVQATIVA